MLLAEVNFKMLQRTVKIHMQADKFWMKTKWPVYQEQILQNLGSLNSRIHILGFYTHVQVLF